MATQENYKGGGLRLALFALGVCAVSLALGVSLAGATKVVKLSFGEAGTLGGQFQGAVGVAVNSSGAGAADPGDVYVVESTNNRVQRFDGDGNFIAAFGADVISNGAQGTGNLTAGSTTIGSVITTSKAFEVGQTLTGTGIPPATTITALGEEPLPSPTLRRPLRPASLSLLPREPAMCLPTRSRPSGLGPTLLAVLSPSPSRSRIRPLVKRRPRPFPSTPPLRKCRQR